ncbi:MAG: redoxin domain-containing protein [Planctomycetes bacterium]|nr:redoxin domain-containing protein [Planctomycetota bacterium]
MQVWKLILATGWLTVAGCAGTESGARSTESTCPIRQVVADSAAEIQPLELGQTIPNVKLRQPDGISVQTHDVVALKPTVLVIYRGGWCPYCTRHLRDLAEIESQLRESGYQIVAVSPDRPEELAKSIVNEKLTYTLLSDSDIALAKAMGLAFHIDDPMYTRLKGMGMDLERASGRDHHVLPVPAVYLLDKTGTIHFAYWNPDYKTRLSGDALLAAARRLAATSVR